MVKNIQIPIKIDAEEKELIEQALLKAKTENYLLTRASLFIWLAKRYLLETKG